MIQRRRNKSLFRPNMRTDEVRLSLIETKKSLIVDPVRYNGENIAPKTNMLKKKLPALFGSEAKPSSKQHLRQSYSSIFGVTSLSSIKNKRERGDSLTHMIFDPTFYCHSVPDVSMFIRQIRDSYKRTLMILGGKMARKVAEFKLVQELMHDQFNQVCNETMVKIKEHEQHNKMDQLSFTQLKQNIINEELKVFATFLSILKNKQICTDSAYVLKAVSYFYETFKVRENNRFYFLVMRKLCKMLMLYNLYEEALIFLNFLKNLFNGTDQLKEAMKVYLLFSECLLVTGRYSFCVGYVSKVLYFSWHLKDEKTEMKAYDLFSQYFYHKENIEMSRFYQDRFTLGKSEPENSKYRQIGLEKFRLVMEKKKLREMKALHANNRFMELKSKLKKLDISFDVIDQQDEDPVVDMTGFHQYTQIHNPRPDFREIYKSKFKRPYVIKTHKSVARLMKNYFVQQIDPNMKRLARDYSLVNFKPTPLALHQLSQNIHELQIILGAFVDFLEGI